MLLTLLCACAFVATTSHQDASPFASKTWWWFAVAAALGGYVRTLFDIIEDASTGDLSPGQVLYACARLAISVPFAGAVAGFVFYLQNSNSMRMPIAAAFLLACVPTRGIFKIARRLLVMTRVLGDESGNRESELQKLEGIDRIKAEKFADEGITTIAQLAASNPVILTMRTNLQFCFVLECQSQAILHKFFGKGIAKLRKHGVRGALEAACIFCECTSGPREAEEWFAEAASVLDLPPESLKRTFKALALDPHTVFISVIWHLIEQASELLYEDLLTGKQTGKESGYPGVTTPPLPHGTPCDPTIVGLPKGKVEEYAAAQSKHSAKPIA